MNTPYKANLSEPELIAAIRSKNRLASEALYTMYSRTLFYAIFRMVKNKEVAEDILQQVFLKSWNSFDQYNEEKGRLFTWMINIARHLSADELRSKRYQKSQLNQDLESANTYLDKHYHVSYNVDCYGIKEYVHRLNVTQAQILNLVYFKGYTHAEAAQELQLPLGTVKTRVRVALQSLRTFFVNDSAGLKNAS